MDTQNGINEVVLNDYLRLTRVFSPKVVERMNEAFGDEGVNIFLFDKLLKVEWYNYVSRN